MDDDASLKKLGTEAMLWSGPENFLWGLVPVRRVPIRPSKFIIPGPPVWFERQKSFLKNASGEKTYNEDSSGHRGVFIKVGVYAFFALPNAAFLSPEAWIGPSRLKWKCADLT